MLWGVSWLLLGCDLLWVIFILQIQTRVVSSGRSEWCLFLKQVRLSGRFREINSMVVKNIQNYMTANEMMFVLMTQISTKKMLFCLRTKLL